MKSGVFWVIEDKLLAFPFGTVDTQNGIAKSGTSYNHKRLWEEIKPRRCNKSYNYYPRGRVEINTHNKVVIYMNPNIGAGEVIPIEIKSNNSRANSLKSLMRKYPDLSYGYKFVDGNIGIDNDGIITLPLYMAAFI